MNIEWFDRKTLETLIGDHILKTDIVLDIGCGIRPQTFFQPKLHICCDPYEEYVKILQNRFSDNRNVLILHGTWDSVIKLFPNHSIDSIFLIDVIEHIEKDEGWNLLKECERVARKQIVIFSPLGFVSQEYQSGDVDGWGLDGTDWQVHKSGWVPEDFDNSWKILGSKEYHYVDPKGEIIDPPYGALWIIKNIPSIKIRLKTRVAILSHILPPSPSGQAIMLGRILRDIYANDYCLVSRKDYNTYKQTYFQNDCSRLHTRYNHLRSEKQLPTLNIPLIRGIVKIFNAAMRVIQRSINVARIINQEKCQLIIACSGDLYDLPAGYLASKLTRVPFDSYIFDDYVKQWIRRWDRILANRFASIIMRGSKRVLVPNEFLRDDYRQRYRIKPVVIHNPSETIDIDSSIPWPAKPGEIRIVYTGAIYHAHYDAFRHLLEAIRLLKQFNLKVHIYTNQPLPELEQHHITGPIEYHSHLPSSKIIEIQCQADILFLPLAFDSSIPEVIRTSAPGKLGEYLATGRPVLAHVPSDTYVSWYFNTHKVGQLVDLPDSTALANGIRQIIENPDFRQIWHDNALTRTRLDFSVEKARAQFIELINDT